MLSYFLPVITPGLTHHHNFPSQLDILQVFDILAQLHLPPELIPRILDEAEYWSSCRRMNTKCLSVEHSIYPNTSPHRRWHN